jgi:hypothetical protein
MSANIPNCHKLYQLFPFQGHAKYNPVGFFVYVEMYLLATRGNAERVTDLHVADGSKGREFESRGRRFFLWQNINPRMELLTAEVNAHSFW